MNLPQRANLNGRATAIPVDAPVLAGNKATEYASKKNVGKAKKALLKKLIKKGK